MVDTIISRRSVLAGLGVLAGGLVAPRLAAAATASPDANTALWRGLALEGRDGRVFQVGDRGAPLTLVTMWAHWCPACLAEMTSLATLAATLGPRIDITLVSHPEYWQRDIAIAQQHRIALRLATPSSLNDRGVVRAALLQDGAYDVPRSLVFRARDNAIAWSQLGSMDWAAATTVDRLRALA